MLRLAGTCGSRVARVRGAHGVKARRFAAATFFRHNRVSNDWVRRRRAPRQLHAAHPALIANVCLLHPLCCWSLAIQVVFAPNRGDRPKQFEDPREAPTPQLHAAHEPDCPFCLGNEAMTGDALLTVPAEGRQAVPGGGDWALRVVRNKYPVVSAPEGATDADAAPPSAWDGDEHSLDYLDFPAQVVGRGRHEVVVETPLHNEELCSRSADRLGALALAWRERGRDMRDEAGLRHICVFKNCGEHSGASLYHPHSQVVGLPIVPNEALSRVQHQAHCFRRYGECVGCHELRREEADGSRVVASNELFTAFVPYAAVSPFQVWMVPRRHGHTLLDATDDELDAFADALSVVTRQLDAALGSPSFNLLVHNAPVVSRFVADPQPHAPGLRAANIAESMHWYAEIFPRLGGLAGFEFGSGMFSNSNLPDDNVRARHARFVDMPVRDVRILTTRLCPGRVVTVDRRRCSDLQWPSDQR